MRVETSGNHVVQALNVVYWTAYYYPAGTYLLKVNNRNTRVRCEICSKLTIKTPERRRSSVFISNFEHISRSSVSIVNFEHGNADWVVRTSSNSSAH